MKLIFCINKNLKPIMMAYGNGAANMIKNIKRISFLQCFLNLFSRSQATAGDNIHLPVF